MHFFRRVAAGAASAIAVGIGILVLWGLVEPYFIDEENEVAVVPDLPSVWEGERFIMMADWQIGMWLDNESTIRRAVERLVEDPPRFVLIAGDFVYHSASGKGDEIEQAAQMLDPLTQAGVPVYAVLGNHDYGMQQPEGIPDQDLAQRVTEALSRTGVVVLENEAAALPAPGTRERSSASSTLYIVGVGPSWPGRADPQAALADVPERAPRLVVMHNPNAFADFPAGTAPVALAGHTHGGQVRLPLSPGWSWMTYYKDDAVHADGWVATNYGEGENRLYVNRGMGFSLAPLRVNAMPELTTFTLKAP